MRADRCAWLDGRARLNFIRDYFKEDLEKHFTEEEQLLFSKLPADDVLRKQAESDHKTIYKLVAAIEKKKDNPMLLNQLADELEKHIRFEERELFNHMQDIFTTADLEVIANRFSNSDMAIDKKWLVYTSFVTHVIAFSTFKMNRLLHTASSVR